MRIVVVVAVIVVCKVLVFHTCQRIHCPALGHEVPWEFPKRTRFLVNSTRDRGGHKNSVVCCCLRGILLLLLLLCATVKRALAPAGRRAGQRQTAASVVVNMLLENKMLLLMKERMAKLLIIERRLGPAFWRVLRPADNLAGTLPPSNVRRHFRPSD